MIGVVGILFTPFRKEYDIYLGLPEKPVGPFGEHHGCNILDAFPLWNWFQQFHLIQDVFHVVRQRNVGKAPVIPESINSDLLGQKDQKFLRKLYAVMEENIADAEFNVGLMVERIGMSRTNLF